MIIMRKEGMKKQISHKRNAKKKKRRKKYDGNAV
jgi:hypothetical protein